MGRIAKCLLANETGEILSASIGIAQVMFGDHVIDQLHWIIEWFIAPFALMLRLNWFAGMEEHVFVQIRLLAVRFIANGASILFLRADLTRMDFHVHGQTGGLRKRFITLLACKWTFARMYSHVGVQ